MYSKAMFAKQFKISIHALREEGDAGVDTLTSRMTDFYPRPPRGGRPSGIQYP